MSARARERHRGRPNNPKPVARSSAADFGSGWAWLLLIALAVVTFAPALNGQFLWDDDAHVTRPELRSVAGLVRIWFEPGATQQYYPLLHTVFWIQQHLWGDAVFGYHLVSLLLHATSVVLLWLILRRLEVGGVWLAAANLANLLMERGDTSQAIEHYRRSLAIAPRNVVARTNLGIALTRMGRLQDARAEFEEASSDAKLCAGRTQPRGVEAGGRGAQGLATWPSSRSVELAAHDVDQDLRRTSPRTA